jgi:hypothetical protein
MALFKAPSFRIEPAATPESPPPVAPSSPQLVVAPPPPPPTVIVDWVQEAALASTVLTTPYPLHRASVVTIGRTDENNIVMPVHQVSRKHALVKWDGDAFVVIDQRSTNGTYVNGESIQRRRLESGDVIGVGPFELAFDRGAPKPRRPHDSTVVVAIPGAFSGDLEEVTVPEICQLIELNQKTGVLVFHEGTRHGKVFFSSGRAVHAEFRDLLGDEAATELLSLTRGGFRFLARETVSVQTTIRKPTALLLLEAAQRADEGAVDGGRGRNPPDEMS